MFLTTPAGQRIALDDIPRKLALRAELPGARVYDLAADALRSVTNADARLTLALPASWLVNSPAPSPILRRWALQPSRDVFLALAGAVGAWPEEKSIAIECLDALGEEPFSIEAVSKVLALLAPSSVPLMPAPARRFVLGHENADAGAFADMIDWFQSTTHPNLVVDNDPKLDPPQVLDRLLWWESEGHRHFA